MGVFEFEDHSWDAFCEATATRGPLEYFHSAVEFVDGNRGAGRLAIDVGCGGGADARDLLARGWRVIALDSSPSSRRLLEERTPDTVRDRLEIMTESFHVAELPEADLVFAQFSLPFAGEDFDASVRNVLSSVTDGGAFVGQLFGENDDWAADPNVASVDRAWIDRAFEGFSVVEVNERNHLGSYGTENDSKHWHFFHIRARR